MKRRRDSSKPCRKILQNKAVRFFGNGTEDFLEMTEGAKREDIDTHGLPGLIQHKKNPLYLVAKKRIECI